MLHMAGGGLDRHDPCQVKLNTGVKKRRRMSAVLGTLHGNSTAWPVCSVGAVASV